MSTNRVVNSTCLGYNRNKKWNMRLAISTGDFVYTCHSAQSTREGEAMRKPMKTSDQLIDHLKNKGVQFGIISEDDAKKHLSQHNNYFKLSSYRKNYTKADKGQHAGQYERLEFAYLIELARLDTEIRHLLLQMSLDIEHFLKVALIKAVEDRMSTVGDEDGYAIINGFLLGDDVEAIAARSDVISKRTRNFTRAVNQNRSNPYCGGLIANYSDEMPIWAFVELSSFGDLRDLIEYYSKKTGWQPPVDLQSLDRVRQIRNACAHGNAIINDLRPLSNQKAGKTGKSTTPPFITRFVGNAKISSTSREKKLSNPRINQIVHLLYIYDIVVTSKNTRGKRLGELDSLINTRMLEHKDYFTSNQLLSSTHQFFCKLVGSVARVLESEVPTGESEATCETSEK